MTGTSHAITGAVIAIVIKRPELAIPIAFFSHFVMDAIPHFDATKGTSSFAKKTIAIDLFIASLVVCIAPFILGSQVSWWTVLLSSFACMSPDVVWGWRLHKYRDLKKAGSAPMLKLTRLHQKIQWSESLWAFWVEIVWILVMIFVASSVWVK